MKQNPQHIRESLWRRTLTAAERAELNRQPEAATELELESRLTEVIAKLPDATVPSNFTARLMQAVDREDSRPGRRWGFGGNWHAWLPRIAVATALVLLAGLAGLHWERSHQRITFAKSVALVAQSQPLPSVEALNNFDAIQRMSHPARADDELLALLQ